jgi:hypothetical protein
VDWKRSISRQISRDRARGSRQYPTKQQRCYSGAIERQWTETGVQISAERLADLARGSRQYPTKHTNMLSGVLA